MRELLRTLDPRCLAGRFVLRYAGQAMRRRSRIRWALVATLLSVSLVAASADAAGLGKARVRVVAVDEAASISISGSATVPARAASARGRRFVVLFNLSGDGRSERFQASLNHRDRFAVTHATKLIGVLKLRARVSMNGRPVGATAAAIVTVAYPPTAGDPAVSSPATPAQPAPAPPPTPTRPPEEPHVVLCSPPVLPALGQGMGIVTGYVYTGGGPPPGEEVCEGGTITLTPCYVTQLCPALSTISSFGPEREAIVEKFGNDEGYAVAVPAGEYIFHFIPSGIHVSMGSKEVEAECAPNQEIRIAAGEVVKMQTIDCNIP